MRRVSNGTGGTHFYLYDVPQPQSGPAKCALDWVWAHPETGLVVAGH